MTDDPNDLRGWTDEQLIEEIESLRAQLALLGGAATAVADKSPGLRAVLLAVPYLRTLPSAKLMIDRLEGEQPRRCDTNVVGAAGECLACDAEQGVSCQAKRERGP